MSNKLSEIRRVLLVARKPSQEEFTEASKVTGMGILLIGMVGFLIMAIGRLLLGGA
ncbi:MAG: protein translocase SEC61 complex subunit gamma [Hadesarchaea archaeon]|nr:MAG: protein translocase SEC61 complex subunit gamma [Hadesarchaea archaeon]TDA35398.1 MAG: protein translocase SEC61 complex subunit gamma [Hadesarchaea archaeon]